MSSHDEVGGGVAVREGWFVRAAAVVGDLSNPFYREERQRDVWNEACAVGLQVVLWLGMATAAAMTWVGGATGLPYAVAVLVLVGAAAWVTILYAARLGVQVERTESVLRLRLVPYAALLVLFFVGAVRAAPADGFGGSFAKGMVIGGALAVLWLTWSGLRARSRERAARSAAA